MTEEHRVQFIHENSWCGEGSRTKIKTKCCVTERKRARATWARVEFTGNVPVLSMDKKEVEGDGDQTFYHCSMLMLLDCYRGTETHSPTIF